MSTPPIEFETARLRARQWRDADRVPFAEMNADPRVMEFFPATLDREESDAFADRLTALIAERGFGFWALETREGGEFVGFAGLKATPPDMPFPPGVEIGWRLAFRHWGKGYATEAAREALRIGFERLGLDEILSFAVIGNRRSRAVMERVHLREAGSFEHPHLPEGSPLRPHCLYRLTREDWRKPDR